MLPDDVRLKWGHTLLDPQGNEIQVPAKVLITLRRLGLLIKRDGYPQISGRIHELLNPEYDALTGCLRQVLGQDLKGPKWLVCTCKHCRYQPERTREQNDRLVDFMLDMHRQRASGR